jgi:chaperonin GroEL
VDIDDKKEDLLKNIERAKTEFEKKVFVDRLAKLTGGVGVITVGASTDTEAGEIKDRYDDTLAAIRSALEEGVVPGGGVCYLRLSEMMDEAQIGDNKDQSFGVAIVKEAILSQIINVLANAGMSHEYVVEKIKDNEDKFHGYDVKNNEYVNMFDAGIIDPAKVVRVALENAASVAGMLLTTEACITFPDLDK